MTFLTIFALGTNISLMLWPLRSSGGQATKCARRFHQAQASLRYFPRSGLSGRVILLRRQSFQGLSGGIV